MDTVLAVCQQRYRPNRSSESVLAGGQVTGYVLALESEVLIDIDRSSVLWRVASARPLNMLCSKSWRQQDVVKLSETNAAMSALLNRELSIACLSVNGERQD